MKLAAFVALRSTRRRHDPLAFIVQPAYRSTRPVTFTPNQYAAGATAMPILNGGKEGQSVADAAKDKPRDSHFNPLDKVAFEKDLAATLLASAKLYDATVSLVSSKIFGYFEQRLTNGMTAGLKAAHDKYEQDLAALTEKSTPGWRGAVETAADATKAEIAAQTKQTLLKGTLPQKLAVHQNFISVLAEDWSKGVMQAILGTADKTNPWYVRQETKLKDGRLDQADGERVFKQPGDSDAEAARIEAERGRVKRGAMGAVGPAGPGIAARDEHGTDPTALPGVTDPQRVTRGIDAYTMDC